MTSLSEQRCVACRADSPHVTDAEVAELHPGVAEWRVVTENNVRKLRRTFQLPDFRQALTFTSSVGDVAEEEGHHPRLVTEWGRVTVTWWTQAIKDIHRNDFIMAAKTDRLYDRDGS
jgi:4a-hydroxytetrahydrobiopterin dehydratase